MPDFAPVKGATIWRPFTGPARDPSRGHLYILLTDPSPQKQNLIVPVCGLTDKSDRTCLLNPGDHEFVKKPSFVMYAKIEQYDSRVIAARVDEQYFLDKGALDPRVLDRVCDGVLRSGSTPLWARKAFAIQNR